MRWREGKSCFALFVQRVFFSLLFFSLRRPQKETMRELWARTRNRRRRACRYKFLSSLFSQRAQRAQGGENRFHSPLCASYSFRGRSAQMRKKLERSFLATCVHIVGNDTQKVAQSNEDGGAQTDQRSTVANKMSLVFVTDQGL